MERWKKIKGCPSYEVSTLGNVRNITTMKNRKFQLNHFGYQMVMIYDRYGKRHNASVHRLVAKAFMRNKENKPEVNHIDAIKTNNTLKNLEWVTKSENKIHFYNLLRSRKKEQSKVSTPGRKAQMFQHGNYYSFY